MKGYVEKLIAEYPDMKRSLVEAKKQLGALKNNRISEKDIIESLTFTHPDGDQVQTSNISDKTANIAISYKSKMRRLYEEPFNYWMKRYAILDQEISFLEESIKSLPKEQREIMKALVLDQMTWDNIEIYFCMSRKMISTIRHDAICSLVRIYQKRESRDVLLLLG